MDQPANEVAKLEVVLNAFHRWEDLDSQKSSARNKNRRKHEPIRERIE